MIHSGTSYKACSFIHHSTHDDKALYYRRLRPPLKAWQPNRAYQPPLLAGMPLVHS